MDVFGVLDKNQIPFTQERFAEEPELAQEFLEIYESNCYRISPKWRELDNDTMLRLASNKLRSLLLDLAKSNEVKIQGLLL